MVIYNVKLSLLLLILILHSHSFSQDYTRKELKASSKYLIPLPPDTSSYIGMCYEDMFTYYIAINKTFIKENSVQFSSIGLKKSKQFFIENYLDIANANFRSGHFRKAIKVCNFIIKEDSLNIKAYWIRSNSYLGIKKYKNAIYDLDIVLEKPHNICPIYYKAIALAKNHQLNEALSSINSAIVLDDSYYAPYYLRAYLLEELGNPSDAELDYKTGYSLFLKAKKKIESIEYENMTLDEPQKKNILY